MTRYMNLNGDSGVAQYEVGLDYIIVEFHGGASYLYNHNKPGEIDVSKMKTLAASGKGLNGHISRHVKKNYHKKLK